MSLPDMTKTGTTHRERYLFPTVPVPPTSVAQQAGLITGRAIPATTNRSTDARLTLSGLLRQTAGNDPQITVKIQDLGRSTRKGATVPRFVVQRSNGIGVNDGASWAKLTRNFALKETISLGTGAALSGAPAFAEDANGVMYLACIAEFATEVRLVIKSFNPATDTAWQVFTDQQLLTIPPLTNPSYGALSLARRGSDIYGAIAWWGASRGSSTLWFVLPKTAGDVISVGASLVAKYVKYDGGISIDCAGDDVLVALGTYASATVTRTTQIARSRDLRTWDTVDNDPAFPTFATLSNMLAGAWGVVTDITFGDSNNGWAVTSAGRIYRTTNAGQSWAVCNIPIPDPRYCTFGFDAISAGLVTSGTWFLFAVGWIRINGAMTGVIYRSVNNGATWAVVPTIDNAAMFDATQLATVTTPSLSSYALHDVAFTSWQVGWAVGDHGTVLYTGDGGDTWTTVRALNDSDYANLYAVVADGSGNILVAGDRQEAGQITTAGNRNSRTILITGATTAIDPNAAANTYGVAIDTDNAAPIVSLTQPTSVALTNAGSVAYGLTADGIVYRWNGNGTTGTWTKLATLTPRTPARYRKIASPAGVSATVYILGPDSASPSTIWRSDTGTTTGTFAPQSGSPRAQALYCIDANNGYVGGVGLYRFGGASDNRCFPMLKTLDSGAVLFACSNMTLGEVELYRAPDANLHWVKVATGISFTPQTTSISTIDTTKVFAPSITIADNGDVLLTAGTAARVSTDDGVTWVDGEDTNLSLMFGTLPADADYTQAAINATRTIFAPSNQNQIYAACNKPGTQYVGVFTAREWSTSGDDALPILSKPQWLGLDKLRGLFVGHPAVGDQWTIAPQYRYTKANFTLYETPSVGWRSTGTSTELTLLWDRQDADTVDVLDSGQFWDVTGMAFFGANIQTCIFGVSDPTNDASFTEYTSTVSLASGTCVRLGSGASNVYRDSTKAWTPGLWNAGQRQRYVRLTSGTIRGTTTANASTTISAAAGKFLSDVRVGDFIALSTAATTWACVTAIASDTSMTVSTALGNGTSQTILLDASFRILTSSTDSLIINGNPTLSGTITYAIFGDRHAWLGGGGSGPGAAGLRDTIYRFSRYARIRIPAQPTADGYFQVGTPILGTEPPPDTEGRSFAYGWSWQALTNTTEETGLAGVSSVVHHGRTAQVWALTYVAEKLDAVLRRLQPLMDAMRKPFCMLFDGADGDSAELVRLVDATKYQNIAGDRMNSPIALKEIP